MSYLQNDVLFVLKKAKNINVKVFQIIANKNETLG